MNKRDYVLIVEDSPTQLAQMQFLLEEADYQTETVVNGQVGLDRVRQELPMLVVTDLHMPVMNGLELVEMLKMEFPCLPVLLTTAEGSEEIAIEALRKGAASYVPKRNLEEMLLSTVEQLMGLAEASRKAELLADHLTCVDIELVLPNDDSLLPQIIARLQRPVEELKICSDATIFTIATALDEALRNAMIHGNLEVSSDLREIDGGKPYADLIRQRRTESPYCDRRVHISLKTTREEAVFVIRDEGPGFDPKLIPDPTDPDNFEKVSGRGLMLIQAFMDEVRHNDNGSEITMIKRPIGPDDDDDEEREETMPMQFFVRDDHADVVVLKIFEPQLSDLALEDHLIMALTDFVDSQQPKKLLLDLSDVEYCATGVINTFLLLRKQVLQLGGEFKLCSLCHPLRIALRSLNLDETVFSIHESVEDGLKSFSASAKPDS